MEAKKRKPIRRRIQSIVMTICIVAVLVAGVVGLISMFSIRSISEKALIGGTVQNVGNLAQSKAELADAELNAYEATVQRLAEYIDDLYAHPDRYVRREILPPSKAAAGEYVLQRGFVSEEIKLQDVEDELGLLSNVEQAFRPVILGAKGTITTMYLGTESGVMISYDAASEVGDNEEGSEIYFNYRERPWYVATITQDGSSISPVYTDDYGRGLMISVAAPFQNAAGENHGVVCIDILISDLYNEVVRLDMEEEAYAFLVDSEGNMISPDSSGGSIYQNAELDDSVRQSILNRKTGVEQAQTGVYFAYAPVSAVPWMFCIRIPQSMILEPVSQIESSISRSILSYIGVIILVSLFVTLIVGKFSVSLTEPLIELGNDARAISGGDFDHRAEGYANDEIGDLAVTFNDMAAALKQFITDLTAVTAEKERIGAELNVATQIQADMLPRIFPPFPDRNEFDLYATMTPAKEVGGDFYDFFLVDEDHLGLVMADVSGKGVPAALFMVIAKTLIKNRAQMGGGPAEILRYVNEQLCEGNEAELFVTVWLAIVELSTGRGPAANAGHEHPVIRRADGSWELSIYRHSPAVATMEGIRFREHSFELHPGDALFVYTDGVAEATDASNELFGTDRMLAALNREPDAEPRRLLENVKEELDAFVGSAPQFDDITMLSMIYNGSEGRTT